MAKKRGNNEGSITRRPNGRWMAQVTIGRDPATGKPKRATFYGKTPNPVDPAFIATLGDALAAAEQGTPLRDVLVQLRGLYRRCTSLPHMEDLA